MPRGVYQRRPRASKPIPAAEPTMPLAEAIADATWLDPAQMNLGDLADVQVAGVTITIDDSDEPDEPEQPRRFLSGAPVVKPEAPVAAPSPISCTMVQRLWKGEYPVWQCAACRLDTLDPALAKCPKGLK